MSKRKAKAVVQPTTEDTNEGPALTAMEELLRQAVEENVQSTAEEEEAIEDLSHIFGEFMEGEPLPLNPKPIMTPKQKSFSMGLITPHSFDVVGSHPAKKPKTTMQEIDHVTTQIIRNKKELIDLEARLIKLKDKARKEINSMEKRLGALK